MASLSERAKTSSYQDSLTQFPGVRKRGDLPVVGRKLQAHTGETLHFIDEQGDAAAFLSHHEVRIGYASVEHEDLARGAFSILTHLLKGSEAWYQNTYTDDNNQLVSVSKNPKSLAQRIEEKLHGLRIPFGRLDFLDIALSAISDTFRDFGEIYPNLAPVLSETMAHAGVDGIRLALQAAKTGDVDPQTSESIWPLRELGIHAFVGFHRRSDGKHLLEVLDEAREAAQSGDILLTVETYEKICTGLSSGQAILAQIAEVLDVHPEFTTFHSLDGLSENEIKKIRERISAQILENARHARKAMKLDPFEENRLIRGN